MDIIVVKAVTKTIGSLAVSYPYVRRLEVARLIDGLTTVGKGRNISTGQVVEILVRKSLFIEA